MQDIFNYLIQSTNELGYLGIFILMFLESFIIPFLGKLILVPAGYLVFNEELSISLVLLSSISGSLTGALLNYFISKLLIRKVISAKRLLMLQTYFIPYSKSIIFISNSLPISKQFISVISGLSKININSFLIYSFLSTLLLNLIFLALGYFIGNDFGLVNLYYERILYAILVFSLMFIIVYYAKQLSKKNILIKIIRIFIIFIILPIIIFAIIWANYLFVYGNFHKVSDNIYRSSQIRSYNMMSYHIKNNNIKTILNLRGAQEDATWYIKEKQYAKDNNMTLINYRLLAGSNYTIDEMDDIISTIKNAPKPLLIHCKSGADRTSLVSALYAYSLDKNAVNASKQISIIYGHFPWLGSVTVAMDKSFQRYIDEK